MDSRVTSGLFMICPLVLLVVTRFNRRKDRVNTMMGLAILRNKSISASSAIASVVYSLVQNHILKACLGEEFNLT